jgi:hypothetical protein
LSSRHQHDTAQGAKRLAYEGDVWIGNDFHAVEAVV